MIGECEKSLVHGTNTPLHRAFSCYLFNDRGEVLVTRRALSKLTWPGVWTNSFCGHPAPGETFEEAISRRAAQELGAIVTDITVAIPGFRYRAVDASGVVENEICPVYTARLEGALDPAPSEVAEWSWVSQESLISSRAHTPFVFSPWMNEQLSQLIESGRISSENRA
ncbi:isopentenyl-diphosphate Delta-isomerase [Leucobacter insecticola]|uniref:isopentenyl-diphosphate Delta-isomerase n=1 Tax=Leucobacter insecticola TaxID=2714934 RepID=UPI001FCC55CA|nr:isopentenyl-diphosphate Delta-isomerase [Leucobacter insecticola]